MVKSVKLADIAAELNVSIVTVSKALSGQKGVSEELRKKIVELADEMGYVPVHSAQKNRSKSYTIGVISLENYFAKFASFYWKMYQEVATKAVKKNCFTMLEVVSSVAEEALEPPKLLEEDRVDGIIIILPRGTQGTGPYPHPDFCRSHHRAAGSRHRRLCQGRPGAGPHQVIGNFPLFHQSPSGAHSGRGFFIMKIFTLEISFGVC